MGSIDRAPLFIHARTLTARLQFQRHLSEGRRLLAGFDGQVAITTNTFLSKDGTRINQGGSERYALDLCRLIQSHFGLTPWVFETTRHGRCRVGHHDGIPVVSLPVSGKHTIFSHAFHQLLAPRPPKLTLYTYLPHLAERAFHPNISLSHGVFWDFYDPEKQAYTAPFLAGAQAADQLVSVDTNTLASFRAMGNFQALESRAHYVPNYADDPGAGPDTLPPPCHLTVAQLAESGQRLRILYPRRLSHARGVDLFLQAATELLADARYRDILHFTFLGEEDKDVWTQAIDQLCGAYPQAVTRQVAEFDAMAGHYQDADIVVVPTRYSEGTSLSLIEAMMHQKAVVTTTVGGLPNLVLPGFNGLMVAPDAQALKRALVTLIESPDTRVQLAARAREVALACFSRPQWEQAWVTLLAPVLSPSVTK
jgi:glycosyltransferase involved in cell wall biosynthesis